MSTPRHEPRQHARPGRDPARESAVVRQRLRAVTGSGRPALAWHPATAALPQVNPGDSRRVVPAEEATGWLPDRPGPVPEQGREDDDDTVTLAGSADDAVDRMRRRAAETAASAYTAAHGHPTAHSGFADLGDEGRRRWALRPRAAVAALVVVLAIAAAVVLLRTPADGVEPMARLDGAGAAAGLVGAAPDGGVADGVDGAETDAGGRDVTGSPGAGTGSPAPAAGAPGGEVVVHVVGQVTAPGLVSVPAEARVADALEAAGGATTEADLAALNLARTVTDGEQIVVPRPGEAVPAPASAAPAGTGSGASAAGQVDLNTADVAALDALPGIGPVLAERIVAWRTENGPFTTVDELGEVSGIGPAVLADVRDLVRV